MARSTLGFVLLCASACAGASHPASPSTSPGNALWAPLGTSRRSRSATGRSISSRHRSTGSGRVAGDLSRPPPSGTTASTIGSTTSRRRAVRRVPGGDLRHRRARRCQVPDEGLSSEDRLTKALLLDLIDATQEIQVCDADRWTVDQLYGPQVNLPLTAMYYPVGTDKGIDDLVARFGQAGRYFDQQIASLREGLAPRARSRRAAM